MPNGSSIGVLGPVIFKNRLTFHSESGPIPIEWGPQSLKTNGPTSRAAPMSTAQESSSPISARPGAQPVSPWLARLLAALVWVYIAYMIIDWGLWKPLTIHGVDYPKHWLAARAVLEGRSVYIGDQLWMGYNYPQANAIWFFWLGFFSIETAQIVWKLLMLAFLGATWFWAWRTLWPDHVSLGHLSPSDQLVRRAIARHWTLATAAVVFLFQPSISSLYVGNIDPLNTFLAVGMVCALFSGRERLSGVAWGLLALIKMLPVALILPVFLWKRWRVLQGFLGLMVVYFIVLLVMGRLDDEWYFVTEVAPGVPRWWRGISLMPARFVLLAFGLEKEVYDNPHGFDLVSRISLVIFLAGYVWLLIWARRREIGWLRGLELAILAYPLLTPLLEFHHFVWIMPALLLQLRRWLSGQMGLGVACWLMGGWVMLNAGFQSVYQLSALGHWCHFPILAGYGLLIVTSIVEVARGTRSK